MDNHSASRINCNTPEYWDEVYQREWESDEVCSGHYSRDYGPVHDAIIALIPDGSRVLDIACGSGVLCRKIKCKLPRTQVTGVDFSPYVIARNRGVDRSLAIEYICLDIRGSLACLGREFDVITFCEIIEHLEMPEKVVAEAMNLLREGGTFIVTCPHDDEIPDAEHVRPWGHDELFHILAPYSDTISFKHFPPPYYHPWMLAHLIKRSAGE